MIIAILAAMLLPALNVARSKARTITCASQLKQIGHSINMYSDDYQEYMLPACSKNGAYDLTWPGRIVVCGYIPMKAYVNTDGKTPFICPEVLVKTPDKIHGYETSGNYLFNATSYSITSVLAGYHNASQPDFGYKKRSRLTSTSQRMLLMGAKYKGFYNGKAYGCDSEVEYQETLKHATGQNILFADWHVTFRTRQSIPHLWGTVGSASKENKLFWSFDLKYPDLF